MAFLVLWFPSLIYMTYTLLCEMSSPTTVNTLRLSTLLSRSQLQILSTTPASDLMRDSTTLSFGIITSMVPIQQKAEGLKLVSWSWIWRLKIPEKFKVLVWLVCHNDVPTLSLLHHRHIATSATYSRCGEEDKSLLHCLRDCSFSKNIWLKLSFTNHNFFGEESALNWIKINATGSRSTTFLAGLWWTWRHRNQMCLSHETWSLTRINLQIQNTVDLIKATYHTAPVPHIDRMVRWNNNNFNCVVLNVDGSCLGSPTRAGYGGIIRNSAGFYSSGFSGFLATTTDILMAELTAIHRGLLLAAETDIEEMVCYSDSMLSIKLLTEHAFTYHAYAVLVQDIKTCFTPETSPFITVSEKGINVQISWLSLEPPLMKNLSFMLLPQVTSYP